MSVHPHCEGGRIFIVCHIQERTRSQIVFSSPHHKEYFQFHLLSHHFEYFHFLRRNTVMKIRSVVKFRSLENFCDPDSRLRLLAQHPLRPSSPLLDKKITVQTFCLNGEFLLCPREDLNLHVFRHMHLKHAWLPITALGRHLSRA